MFPILIASAHLAIHTCPFGPNRQLAPVLFESFPPTHACPFQLHLFPIIISPFIYPPLCPPLSLWPENVLFSFSVARNASPFLFVHFFPCSIPLPWHFTIACPFLPSESSVAKIQKVPVLSQLYFPSCKDRQFRARFCIEGELSVSDRFRAAKELTVILISLVMTVLTDRWKKRNPIFSIP